MALAHILMRTRFRWISIRLLLSQNGASFGSHQSQSFITSYFILSSIDSKMLRSGILAWFQGGSESNNRPALLCNRGLQYERRLLEDSAKNEKEMKRVLK